MLRNKLLTLPMEPGCYLMKDKNGEVIYVGKAKKLKNRVNSYFHGTHNNKTTKLVSNIVDFEYIVTPSEKEALILEFNLIKKYKPRFNIMFMDDASYPYLRLSLEQYPTLRLVRDAKKMKKAKYFGPYPNVGYARELLGLLEKLYPLRKCKTMPAKVCLYYHLGLCLGPCEYKIEKEVFNKLANNITSFLNGDTKEIKEELVKKRDKYVDDLMFEKAQETQTLLNAIDHVTSSNYMQSDKTKKYDVWGYYVDKGYISIVGLLYSEGKLLHRHLTLKPLYDDEVDELFISYIIQFYDHNPVPKQILLPKEIDIEALSEVLDTKIIQPQRGDKKQLIALAVENASINLNQKFDIINKDDLDKDLALEQLENKIGGPISKIELYDNSHISGSNAVASQVVYIDGKPSKKDYRLYKVSNGNNDFKNMKEVLYRRLLNGLKSKSTMPDIIIVDGGESQINAANSIIKDLEIEGIRVFGLVKNDKHQTSDLMNSNLEIIEIDKESQLFYLLTNMQDEVHRVAISFHKRLRNQTMVQSELDNIEAIGEKRKSKLLKAFGSVKKIKESSVEELSKVVGKVAAESVYNYFHSQNEELEDEINSDERFTWL